MIESAAQGGGPLKSVLVCVIRWPAAGEGDSQGFLGPEKGREGLHEGAERDGGQAAAAEVPFPPWLVGTAQGRCTWLPQGSHTLEGPRSAPAATASSGGLAQKCLGRR